MNNQDDYPAMLTKAALYKHQRKAFKFACRLFGLMESGDGNNGKLQYVRKIDTTETKSRSETTESILQ